MNDLDLDQYEDFIGLYEKLFHLDANESMEEIFNLIEKILISKYKFPIQELISSLIIAIKYNYRSIDHYCKIINQILNKYSRYKFNYESLLNLYMNIFLRFIKIDNKYQICHIPASKENKLMCMIMYDQIDELKEFAVQNSLTNIDLQIPMMRMSNGRFEKTSLIEACCYFGSANIFFFLQSNLCIEVTKKCLQYSFIGGNIDIINECMKTNQLDKDCLSDIVGSHNNKYLEFIFERDLFEPKDFNSETIISSKNLKAVFLLYKKSKGSIMPWCAAFPQCLDIIKKISLIDDKYGLFIKYASLYNNIEVCKYLLNSPDISQMKRSSKSCEIHHVIHSAVSNNYFEITELLLKHGAKINKEKNDYKASLLQIAVENDNKEITEFLVSNGADVNSKNGEGKTPLFYAVENDNKDIVEFLISHGADVNISELINGKIPMHYAIDNNNNKDIVEILVSHGSNVNKYNIIHMTVQKDNKDIVELLIAHGANPHQINLFGKTPFQIAVENQNFEIMELLLLNGAITS